MLTGGCFCSKVRYEVMGEPINPGLCHCTTCQKTSGAPVVAWFSAERRGFRFTSAEPRTFQSSSVGQRGFCRECGTLLIFEDSRYPEVVDVTTATLDEASAIAPADQLWVGSRLPWMSRLDILPELPQGHNTPPPES